MDVDIQAISPLAIFVDFDHGVDGGVWPIHSQSFK